MPLRLSNLHGFRTIREIDYEAPNGQRLKARMVTSDAIHEAEMLFHKVLHNSGLMTTDKMVDNILIPCCCEECGGIDFVQKFVRRHKRIIEVLECVSGNTIVNSIGLRIPCHKQHSIVNGKPKELTPTPTQLQTVKDLYRIDRMRLSETNEAVHATSSEDDDDEPYYMRDFDYGEEDEAAR